MSERQWYMDDDFDTPMPVWLDREVLSCYGPDLGREFAQDLAAFLDARNLEVRRKS